MILIFFSWGSWIQEAEYFAGPDRLPEAHPCQQAQKKGVTRKRKASLNVSS